jgi:pimeloyl-ACP methyl ester carboxylesterase
MSWPDERAALEALLSQREPAAWWAAALEFVDTLERTPDGRLRTIVRESVVAAGWQQMHEPIRTTPWRGPTLLIEAGREDGKFAAPEAVAVMNSELRDALDHRVLDVTHTIPSDHPDLLAALVTEFMAGLGTG